jgi:hypothetical protein
MNVNEKRFAFGQNWYNFSALVDSERIAESVICHCTPDRPGSWQVISGHRLRQRIVWCNTPHEYTMSNLPTERRLSASSAEPS